MATDKKDTPQSKTEDKTPDSVASPAENAKLEHSEGGVTTRDDLHDVGVPMAPVPEDEREGYDHPGPEDALGFEATRGDYRGRIDQGPHMTVEEIPADEREDAVSWVGPDGKPASEGDDDATAIREPAPRTRVVEQTAATPEG